MVQGEDPDTFLVVTDGFGNLGGSGCWWYNRSGRWGRRYDEGYRGKGEIGRIIDGQSEVAMEASTPGGVDRLGIFVELDLEEL
jgi:hypothetical protein